MDFETFFKMNERRIHFQMHRLNISNDLYAEFYSEGIVALWKAYKRFDSNKGNVGTFMNYQIRFRLIDLIRKKVQEQERTEMVVSEEIITNDDGNRKKSASAPLVNTEGIILGNEAFWQEVRRGLTENQWKWVHYFVVANLSVKEIMEIEGVTKDAVKGWAREVRKKLKHEHVREKLEALM